MQREKILEMIVSPKYKPLNIEEVSSLWKLSEIEKIDLKKNVRELINEGKLLEIKKGKLVLPERYGVYMGRLDVNKRGFGFLVRDKALGDIFIPENAMKDAMFSLFG